MAMNKKNQETMNAMITVIKSKGFVGDRYGNYKKTEDGREYRYKFNTTSYRYEKKFGDSWMKLAGAYYKNVKIGGK
jgi:hypothetical protein